MRDADRERALWVEQHYVKGMRVREDDGTERPITNIEMVLLGKLIRERMLERAEREGCCQDAVPNYDFCYYLRRCRAHQLAKEIERMS